MKRLILALLIVSALMHAAPKPTTAQHIQRIENGFAPIPMGKGERPRQLDLTGMMKLFHVPGLSVAVFDQGKILWSRGYGMTEAGANHPVTTHTLFQAGSISKPVTAAATLALVEQGKLALDEDVNLKLRTWKLPENEFTREQKVTLRRILSHTAGLTVHGFPGYASADAATHTTAEPIPTVVQVLDGEKPANTKPVRVEMVPGTKFEYSGGGVTIEQLLVTEAQGKPFPQIMRERVLDKIGMADSTFEQPLPRARLAMAASGTRSDGSVLPGKRHIYPEMAAAGLWTTANDLAKFAIEIANSANGKSNRVLSQKMTQEMLNSQTHDPDPAVGLGFFTSKTNPAQFGHDGADEGFQAILTAYRDTGRGVAIMVNSDNGIQLGEYLVEAISNEYGWKFPVEKHQAVDVIQAIQSTHGLPAGLDWFIELKHSGSTEYQYGPDTLNDLGFHLMQAKELPAAIKVFKLNVDEYPSNANAYDSLGEAYMKAGDNKLAIENYERSLKLDPKNENAVMMLKKLRE